MKAGWQTKSLGDLCQFVGGGTPSKGNASFYTGDIPWATVRDMRSELLFETEFKITKDAIKNSSTNIIPKENVVIATRVGLGKVCLVKQDTAINQDLRGIIPNNKNELSVDFLFSWFKSISQRVIDEGTGATVQGVKLLFIKSLKINVPPIQEQKRIVTILDEAFEQIAIARANTEKNLQNARALFESHLQSAFAQRGNGWLRQKLGEVVTLDKIQHKPSKPLPYVGMEDIESNTGNFLGRHEPKKVKSSTFYFNDTHVIYGRLRPYLNKVMLPDFEGHCSTEVFPLKPCHKIDRKFLFFWLALNSTKELINATCTGARMPRANMNDVLEFDFYYPELASQKKLVLILEALSLETQCLESLYQRKLTALDELKKSLLHKAFAGEL